MGDFGFYFGTDLKTFSETSAATVSWNFVYRLIAPQISAAAFERVLEVKGCSSALLWWCKHLLLSMPAAVRCWLGCFKVLMCHESLYIESCPAYVIKRVVHGLCWTQLLIHVISTCCYKLLIPEDEAALWHALHHPPRLAAHRNREGRHRTCKFRIFEVRAAWDEPSQHAVRIAVCLLYIYIYLSDNWPFAITKHLQGHVMVMSQQQSVSVCSTLTKRCKFKRLVLKTCDR